MSLCQCAPRSSYKRPCPLAAVFFFFSLKNLKDLNFLAVLGDSSLLFCQTFLGSSNTLIPPGAKACSDFRRVVDSAEKETRLMLERVRGFFPLSSLSSFFSRIQLFFSFFPFFDVNPRLYGPPAPFFVTFLFYAPALAISPLSL